MSHLESNRFICHWRKKRQKINLLANVLHSSFTEHKSKCQCCLGAFVFPPPGIFHDMLGSPGSSMIAHNARSINSSNHKPQTTFSFAQSLVNSRMLHHIWAIKISIGQKKTKRLKDKKNWQTKNEQTNKYLIKSRTMRYWINQYRVRCIILGTPRYCSRGSLLVNHHIDLISKF